MAAHWELARSTQRGVAALWHPAQLRPEHRPDTPQPTTLPLAVVETAVADGGGSLQGGRDRDVLDDGATAGQYSPDP